MYHADATSKVDRSKLSENYVKQFELLNSQYPRSSTFVHLWQTLRSDAKNIDREADPEMGQNLAAFLSAFNDFITEI